MGELNALEQLTEQEHWYVTGKRRALIELAAYVQQGLHDLAESSAGDNPARLHERILALEVERQEAIQALRVICKEHGDNEWPDNLHLRDILEKHLEMGDSGR